MENKAKFWTLSMAIAIIAVIFVLWHIYRKSNQSKEAMNAQRKAELLFVEWDMNVRSGMATFSAHDLGCDSFVDFYAMSRDEQRRVIADRLCSEVLRGSILPLRWQCY